MIFFRIEVEAKGIRFSSMSVSGNRTAMTVAEIRATRDDKPYKIPWGLYFCVRLPIIVVLPPSTFPAVVIPTIIPTLTKLMERAMKEPILFGVDAKISPTIADLAIKVVGTKTAVNSFEIDTMIAFVNVIDTTEDDDDDDADTKNDTATIILTTLISRVAPTMTDFRPIESNKLPKIGLKIISKTAPKLAMDDNNFVADAAPN